MKLKNFNIFKKKIKILIIQDSCNYHKNKYCAMIINFKQLLLIYNIIINKISYMI